MIVPIDILAQYPAIGCSGILVALALYSLKEPRIIGLQKISKRTGLSESTVLEAIKKIECQNIFSIIHGKCISGSLREANEYIAIPSGEWRSVEPDKPSKSGYLLKQSKRASKNEELLPLNSGCIKNSKNIEINVNESNLSTVLRQVDSPLPDVVAEIRRIIQGKRYFQELPSLIYSVVLEHGELLSLDIISDILREHFKGEKGQDIANRLMVPIQSFYEQAIQERKKSQNKCPIEDAVGKGYLVPSDYQNEEINNLENEINNPILLEAFGDAEKTKSTLMKIYQNTPRSNASPIYEEKL